MTELKQALVGYLREKLPGVDVLAEYPAAKKRPLDRAVLAVGIEEIELTPAGFGGLLGEEQGREVLGGSAKITARLDIYAPGPPDSGAFCCRIWETVCNALLEKAAAFGVTRLWCENLRWDDGAGTSRLTARVALQGAVIPQTVNLDDASPAAGAVAVRAGEVT